MWGALAKPGGTGQSAIMRNMQKTDWVTFSSFFQFVDNLDMFTIHILGIIFEVI